MGYDRGVKRAVVIGTVSVTAPGTAQQLPSNPVPDGHHLVLTNRRKNTGNFYLGTTAARAQTDANRKELVPSQSVDFAIINSNLLYVDSDNSTDLLELALESNS